MTLEDILKSNDQAVNHFKFRQAVLALNYVIDNACQFITLNTLSVLGDSLAVRGREFDFYNVAVLNLVNISYRRDDLKTDVYFILRSLQEKDSEGGYPP